MLDSDMIVDVDRGNNENIIFFFNNDEYEDAMMITIESRVEQLNICPD